MLFLEYCGGLFLYQKKFFCIFCDIKNFSDEITLWQEAIILLAIWGSSANMADYFSVNAPQKVTAHCH